MDAEPEHKVAPIRTLICGRLAEPVLARVRTTACCVARTTLKRAKISEESQRAVMVQGLGLGKGLGGVQASVEVTTEAIRAPWREC